MKYFLTTLLLIAVLTTFGQTVKNYTLQDMDNANVSLYDLKGEKITILDFWTTWCRPCKKAIPELSKLYEEYSQQGVQIIGVNCDGPRTVAKVPTVSRGMGIQYPVLSDINSEMMNALNYSNFPTLIILDGDFKIQYVHEGFVPGDEIEIKQEIEKYLKK